MKYAVTYRDDFVRIQSETNDFYYGEREYKTIKYLDASNREAAARSFLSKDYDDLLKLGGEAEEYFDESVKTFIEYCTCGDSILEECEKQNEVNKLRDDIKDFYLEKMMDARKVNIMIEN